MFKKIKLFLSQLFNFFLLSIAYLLGIGLTVFFSKSVKKKFLDFSFSKQKKGSFVFFNGSFNLEKMF